MDDFTVVEPTQQEMKMAKTDPSGTRPQFDRVECDECHKRLWASPIGMRSHRRNCHVTRKYVRCTHCREMLPVKNGELIHAETA